MTSPEGNQESQESEESQEPLEDRESRESQELWEKDQKFVLELLPTLAVVDDSAITHCVLYGYQDRGLGQYDSDTSGHSVTGLVAGHKVTLGEHFEDSYYESYVIVDGKTLEFESGTIPPDDFQVLQKRMKSMAKDEHVPSYEEDKLGTEMAKEIEDYDKNE